MKGRPGAAATRGGGAAGRAGGRREIMAHLLPVSRWPSAARWLWVAAALRALYSGRVWTRCRYRNVGDGACSSRAAERAGRWPT